MFGSRSYPQQLAINPENRQPYMQDVFYRCSYFLLQIIDLTLTMVAASLGLLELNPIMSTLLSFPLLLAVTKVGIPFLIILLIPYRFLVPSIIFMSLVVLWNISQLVAFVF